jgi:HAE1 family hydrophobic/amphiphilic exporter-1
MTTLTTVLALVPMAFFGGEGAEMTQPIGKTVLGGLTGGTLMTLFLMPALYYIFNNEAQRKAKRLARAEAKKEWRSAQLETKEIR